MSCVRRTGKHAALLCVVIDDSGPWASTDPAGGRAAWHRATVGIKLDTIDCASVSFCVGGGAGGLAWSTDPTGGKAAWHSFTVGGGEGSYQPSCPTTSFCAAGDSNYGDVLTSTDPAGGKAKWKDVDVTGSTSFGYLSCPTASLCVDSRGGSVLTATRQARGASAWKQTTLTAGVGDLVCPSATECVGPAGVQSVVTSTDPTGGASHWHFAPGPVLSGGPDLSCPVNGLCVSAVKDSIVTSVNPAGGPAGWPKPVPLDGSTEIQSAACPTTRLCVVGDGQGNLISSTDPARGSWRLGPRRSLRDEHHGHLLPGCRPVRGHRKRQRDRLDQPGRPGVGLAHRGGRPGRRHHLDGLPDDRAVRGLRLQRCRGDLD